VVRVDVLVDVRVEGCREVCVEGCVVLVEFCVEGRGVESGDGDSTEAFPGARTGVLGSGGGRLSVDVAASVGVPVL